MPYIGNPIYQSAFVTDQFSGDGSTTAFTMSVAPAGVTNVLVAVSGVLQDPSTYGVTGTTITFSTAPPSGTGNISCRYLGIPVTGIVTTAYRTVTEFTATASQTTFTPPSYTVGFINVYLNGVLLGSADYTATNGTTVVLATGASAGNLLTVESFRVESVLNAISNSAGSVGTNNLAGGSVTAAKMASASVDLASATVTGVLPSANGGTGTTAGVTGFKNRIINGAMVIDQRNAGASISVAANTPSTYFPVDRFFCQSTGTAFTAQRVTGSGSFRNALRLTGASSNTSAFTTQRIESLNTYDLVSQSVTLSAVLSRSSGTTCTWTAYAAGSADNYSSLTTIATGSFTLTSTATAYSATFNAGANAGNGIMIEFSWGALGAGVTVDITGVQLEVGSSATTFDVRSYGTELALCQRYYFQWDWGNGTQFIGVSGYGNSNAALQLQTPVTMRASPTVAFSNTTVSNWQYYSAGNTWTNTSTLNSFSFNQNIYYVGMVTDSTGGSRLLRNNSGSNQTINISAEL